MKPLTLVLAVALLTAVGCNEKSDISCDSPQTDSWLVKSYNDVAIENAIIRQHTMLPYHFIQNSDQLNEIGTRDLGILATHFKKHPGRLNVRKGNVAGDLYEARVQTVLNMMTQVGVDMQKVDVQDTLPGGDGMSSDEVVFILTRQTEAGAGSSTSGASTMTLESN
jgi:hypothetical protein